MRVIQSDRYAFWSSFYSIQADPFELFFIFIRNWNDFQRGKQSPRIFSMRFGVKKKNNHRGILTKWCQEGSATTCAKVRYSSAQNENRANSFLSSAQVSNRLIRSTASVVNSSEKLTVSQLLWRFGLIGGVNCFRASFCQSTDRKNAWFLIAWTPLTWNILDFPEPKRLSTFRSKSCLMMECVSDRSHFGRESWTISILDGVFVVRNAYFFIENFLMQLFFILVDKWRIPSDHLIDQRS